MVFSLRAEDRGAPFSLAADARARPAHVPVARACRASASTIPGAAKVAQERHWHSTITTTLDLCSHVTETMQEAAASRLDAVLGGAIRGIDADIGAIR